MDNLGKILTTKKISDPMSKLDKQYASVLSLLSQLNRESYGLYKEHAINTYLREGKVQAILYLLDDYMSSSASKRNAITKKIKEIKRGLDIQEEKELSLRISELIPKTILKAMIGPNKLSPEVLENINIIIKNDLPIGKDRWSQLFTVIGSFEDNLPLLKYLNKERKRLIRMKEWNKMLDKRLIVPLLSGNPSTLEKWVLVVYTILEDELFELLPSEESKKQVYETLNKIK